MSLLDYHAKNLIPSVWTNDGDLNLRFEAQLEEQLKRFSEFDYVLLVGDAVSHYWQKSSDIDIILIVDREYYPEAKHQALRTSGYPLIETDNRLNFWVLPDNISPSVISKHFGPVYEVLTGNWYGTYVQNEMAMRDPDTILQFVNWKMYKAMQDEELYPYDWKITSEAFMRITDAQRDKVLDNLRYRISKIDHNINKLLRKQPRDIWRLAENVEDQLEEDDELPLEADRLPKKVVYAMLHRMRYMDLLDSLAKIDEKIRTRQNRHAYEAPEHISTDVLYQRILQLSEIILQKQGGSDIAVNGMYDMLRHILDNNRYVYTDMRRRKIAARLFKDYQSQIQSKKQ